MKAGTKHLAILIASLTCISIGSYMYTSLYIAPFRKANPEQVKIFLAQENFQNCDQFLNAHFETENSASIFMRAAAYDLGICVPQDHKKAIAYYEASLDAYPGIAAPALRLAMIYHAGPLALRNEEKADFLFRQTAISLAAFQNEKERSKFIKMTGGINMIPPALQKKFRWLDTIMAKDAATRKYLSQQLRESGFRGTDILWDESFLSIPD